jgi:replicative DNA helicase
MNEVDLNPLRRSIRAHNMMEIWADSIVNLSVDERRERAKSRALRAKVEYLQIMRSERNDGSQDFQAWAIKKVLGLRTRGGHTAQPTGGRNWRAWGK